MQTLPSQLFRRGFAGISFLLDSSLQRCSLAGAESHVHVFLSQIPSTDSIGISESFHELAQTGL